MDRRIVSTYPNVSQILNIERATCVMEFCRIQGKTNEDRRVFGVNLTGGRVNSVELSQLIFDAPPLDAMLEGYLDYKRDKVL